jgi:hypothetical protein
VSASLMRPSGHVFASAGQSGRPAKDRKACSRAGKSTGRRLDGSRPPKPGRARTISVLRQTTGTRAD